MSAPCAAPRILYIGLYTVSHSWISNLRVMSSRSRPTVQVALRRRHMVAVWLQLHVGLKSAISRGAGSAGVQRHHKKRLRV